MIATVLPFLYVMLFGRNIPWWVYVLIAALVAQGACGACPQDAQHSAGRLCDGRVTIVGSTADHSEGRRGAGGRDASDRLHVQRSPCFPCLPPL